MKKLLALLLVLALALSLVACSSNKTPSTDTSTDTPADTSTPDTEAEGLVDPYADLLASDDYETLSDELYDLALGDFNTAYEEAMAEKENVDLRLVKMAAAEAKLLESGLFLPTTSNGGGYAISRVAPNSVTNTMWGTDSSRLHGSIVVTEPITAADRETLKAMWAELAGTGTWQAECKQWLTDNGYTLKDSLTQIYASDPNTWDILSTSQAVDSDVLVNTYDGLLEYDTENVQQPALAESYEMSEDGLTYTFHLRQGVKWVDSQGREVAEVTADDFVAGMQHLCDAMGGLEQLLVPVIANLAEYVSGDITDFSEVGVKAIDEYTLEYTLVEPVPYFTTMIGYSMFAPMNRAFYESKGGKFGDDFDSAASDYTYGKTKDDIAYCGPYLVSNATANNTIVYTANPTYWNPDSRSVQTITWLYNDQEDALKAYNDTMSGVLDGAGLTPAAIEAAKAAGVFDTLAYVSPTDATAFNLFFNVNRIATSNYNDQSCQTSKTAEDITRSRLAMYNQNFRLAVELSVDRAAYNAQWAGEELKYNSLINSYTPGIFLQLENDVTVDIDGTETTFPAGTYYGAILQAFIDSFGLPVKVWDPEADGGIGSSSGFDGWYNAEAAVSYLETAVAELAEQGLEISAENPIYLDMPYFAGSESFANRANAMKQSIEAVLGGAVIINLVTCNSSEEYYSAGYYPATGAEGNYDIYDVSGWSPDYGDVSSYLGTMAPAYAGYMTKQIGVY